MKNKKVYKVIAQRMVVQTLNTNIPDIDAEEEGISENEVEIILKEYNSIKERLRKIAIKNGGEFNQYSG